MEAILEENEFYSPSQLADKLNVSIPTAQRWVANGVFPNAIKLGGRYRVPKVDVEEWVKNSLVSNIISREVQSA